MNFRQSTTCVLMHLLIVQSARINVNEQAGVATSDTLEGKADLTPETFQTQIDEIVKPMYRKYQEDHSSDECQFFAEGTVVLYCMARDQYQGKLGKKAPGDIDYGHYCRGGSQDNLNKFAQYVPVPEEGEVKVRVGAIQILDGSQRPPMLDVHQHELKFGRGARKRTAKYCLCDNECSDVPLMPLDDLKELYTEHKRSNKNDDAKINFIQELMDENDGDSCGPCTAVPLKGRKGFSKPKPKPVATVSPKEKLEAKLATSMRALKLFQDKQQAAERAISTATEQFEAATSEVRLIEEEIQQIQAEIANL